MGIEVKGYKLGGGSLLATIYVQLGRQPIAVQRKAKIAEGGRVTDEFLYETIYVATAHGSKDGAEDKTHICVVRQGGIHSPVPITENVYEFCYKDLKAELAKEGYTEITDVQ